MEITNYTMGDTESRFISIFNTAKVYHAYEIAKIGGDTDLCVGFWKDSLEKK